MTETRLDTPLSRRMRVWAYIIGVAGLLGAIFSTSAAVDLIPDPNATWPFMLASVIARICMYLGLPLAASLFVGSIVVERVDRR